MKRFDQSYARFLLDNGDYERLSRYCQSALDEGFAQAQAFIDICNEKTSVQNDISSEENEIIYNNSTPETVVSNIRCFINYDNGAEEEVSLKDFVKLMKRKSNEGNASAQYLLSEFYLDGNGVRKNVQKAYELMKLSADNGFAAAQHTMAGAYLKGYFYNLTPNIRKGMSYLIKAAEQKFPESLRMLGLYYLKGLYGIEKSPKKAFKYMSEAAELGDADAVYIVSDFCYYGIGTKRSIRKAVSYCESAAEKGVPDALYSMWLYFMDGNAKISFEKAFDYLKAAANKNHADACNDIGELYYDDAEYDEAIRYFEIAAEKECVDAIYNLGDCYYSGEGTHKNYKKAFELYARAAEHKHAEATYSLAWCYDYGQGTKKNKKLAFKWYKEAAKLGHSRAINNLGVCYAIGKGTRKNIRKAIACYTVAAKNNVKESINSLGSFYETGNGLEKDIAKAVEMYQKAVSLGDCTAKFNLARCYEYGMGVEKDISKAVDLYIESTKEYDRERLDKLYKFKINKLSSEDAAKISKRLFETNNSRYKERAMELLIYSAECGNADSQRDLGVRLWNDMQMYSLAFIYFKKSSDQGDPYSAYNLANLYYNGYGITQNYEKALELYKSAAEQDLPVALFELGCAYENGFHGIVSKDLSKAAEYYKKGAELGDVDCKNSLAAMYMKGKGVRKNQKKGFRLFWDISERDKNAKCNLAMCYQHGCGTDKNILAAINIYNKLASEGDTFAIERLEKLSDEIKDASHFFTLGSCYDLGKGVECDAEKAIKYYTIAADMGHDRARHNLAHIYRYGNHGIEINIEKAIEYYSAAVENGVARSINSLGTLYEELGDCEKAVEQYSAASSLGYRDGTFNLAMCIKNGTGIKKDVSLSEELLRKLADKNDIDAMNNLAIMLSDGEATEAFNLFHKAAKMGNTNAMYNLAQCYEEGKCDVEVNPALAIEWYYEAAEKGYEPAIEKLKDFDLLSKADPGHIRKIAFDYYEDEEQEQKLYEIAAKGGDALAMHNLAYNLEKSDPQRAFELYKKAADLKEPYGIYAVAKCYEDGFVVEQNDKQCVKYLKKAAELRIADAITDLGACYGKGAGTSKNIKKAMNLYLKAAILGDSLALTNIAWLYETGTGVKKDIDLAYHLYKSAADNGEKHAIERLEDWE